MVRVSFCGDLAVSNVKLANASRTLLGVGDVVVLLKISSVVDSVVLSLILNNAVVSRAFLKLVLDKNGIEAALVGHLDKIYVKKVSVGGFSRCVSDVIRIVLVASAAVHNVLPIALREPERTLDGVPVLSVTEAVSHKDFLVESGNDNLAWSICGSHGIEKSVNENARSDSVTVSVILSIPEEKTVARFYNVRVDREAVLEGLPVGERTEGSVGRCGAHMLKFVIVRAGNVDIVFSVYLGNGGSPEIAVSVHKSNNALVVPYSENIVCRISLNSVYACNVEIKLLTVLKDKGIGLMLALNVKFKLHNVSSFLCLIEF